MKIEKIKTNFGEIKFFETKEASFNIETIKPKSKLPKCYLKRNNGYLIVLESNIKFNGKILKKGDFINIKRKHKMFIENNSNKSAKYLAIDIPPIKKGDLVFI